MTSSFPTDSYLFLTGDEAGQTEWPATRFPAYTDERLTQFVDHLRAMSNGDLASGLPTLSIAGLYTLVVVLAKAAGVGHGSWTADARITEQLPAAAPALLTELRRRDCRGLGRRSDRAGSPGTPAATGRRVHTPVPTGRHDSPAPEDAGRLPLLLPAGVAAGLAACGDLALLRMRPVRRLARIC